MADQISGADEEDGAKIIRHILGDQSETVVNSLAKDTDLDGADVSKALSNIAPALMSGLSAATTSASKVDLSDFCKKFIDLSSDLDAGFITDDEFRNGCVDRNSPKCDNFIICDQDGVDRSVRRECVGFSIYGSKVILEGNAVLMAGIF